MQAENEKLSQLFSQKEKEWSEFKRKRDGLTNGYVILCSNIVESTCAICTIGCGLCLFACQGSGSPVNPLFAGADWTNQPFLRCTIPSNGAVQLTCMTFLTRMNEKYKTMLKTYTKHLDMVGLACHNI